MSNVFQARRPAARARFRRRGGRAFGMGLVVLCASLIGFGRLATGDDPSPDPPAAPQDRDDQTAPAAPKDDGSDSQDPEVIEPGPDGCPFNNQRLDLIV